MPMNPRKLVPTQEPGILDFAPGAAAAYSLRNLTNLYSGPVVTVRRSTDSAERDFTASEVSDGTLAAWCGGGDGFVKVWHDQSQNGRDASQTTTGYQPQLIDAGSLIIEGGKATVRFDGVDDYLQTNAFSVVGQPYTVFILFRFLSAFSTTVRVMECGDTVLRSGEIMRAATDRLDLYSGTTLQVGGTANLEVFGHHAARFDSSNTTYYRDGVAFFSGDAGTNGANRITLGNNRVFSAPSNVAMSEVIVHPESSAGTQDRITANQMWYY